MYKAVWLGGRAVATWAKHGANTTDKQFPQGKQYRELGPETIVAVVCPASQPCHPLTVNSTMVPLLVVGCAQLPAQSCSVNLGQFHTVLPSDNSLPTNKPKLLILTKFRHSKQAPILHQLGRNISHRWTVRKNGKEDTGNTYLRTTDSC